MTVDDRLSPLVYPGRERLLALPARTRAQLLQLWVARATQSASSLLPVWRAVRPIDNRPDQAHDLARSCDLAVPLKMDDGLLEARETTRRAIAGAASAAGIAADIAALPGGDDTPPVDPGVIAAARAAEYAAEAAAAAHASITYAACMEHMYYLASAHVAQYVASAAYYSGRAIALAGERSEWVERTFAYTVGPGYDMPGHWRTGDAVALARHILASGDLSLMGILADALEEAGCEDAEILRHLREDRDAHSAAEWVLQELAVALA